MTNSLAPRVVIRLGFIIGVCPTERIAARGFMKTNSDPVMARHSKVNAQGGSGSFVIFEARFQVDPESTANFTRAAFGRSTQRTFFARKKSINGLQDIRLPSVVLAKEHCKRPHIKHDLVDRSVAIEFETKGTHESTLT
jgi:hypothetical protein